MHFSQGPEGREKAEQCTEQHKWVELSHKPVTPGFEIALEMPRSPWLVHLEQDLSLGGRLSTVGTVWVTGLHGWTLDVVVMQGGCGLAAAAAGTSSFALVEFALQETWYTAVVCYGEDFTQVDTKP